jgi:hypothetical protein
MSETSGDPLSPSPNPDTAPEPTPGFWEDFIDIFFEPASVFERRKGWSAWPVLLGLTAVMVVLFIGWQRVLGPVMDLEMAARMTEAPDLDPAQIEQMRSAGRIFGAVGVALAFPLGLLVMAVVTWGLARLFGATAGFAGVLGVLVYSQVVRALAFVAGILQSFVLDVNRLDSIHDVSLSLARFLDQPEASAMAVNLAARVDLFVLWATALIAVGLRVAVGLSRGSAWAVAAVVWLLAALPTVAGALIGG